MAETISELKVAIGADLSKLSAQLSSMESKIGKAGERSANSFTKSMNKIESALTGVFTVSLLEQVLTKAIEVTAEFEKMGAVLSTSLGSDAEAKLAMMNIVDFASKTPFQVNELTDAFVKFSGRGIKPSMESMRAMGDLSAALGKDFSQLSEAILDVSNTQRWTDLGIKVSSSGNKIIGTYRGVTIEAERTEAGAMAMAEAFGNLEGVSGGMARVSETLAGKLSNLADNYDTLLRKLGESGAFSNATDLINDMLVQVTDFTTYIGNDTIPTWKKLIQIWNPLKLFVDFEDMNKSSQEATKAALEQTAGVKKQVDQFKELLKVRGQLDNAGVKYDSSQSFNLGYLTELLDKYNATLDESDKNSLKNAKALEVWTSKVEAASEAAKELGESIIDSMINMKFTGLYFPGKSADMTLQPVGMDEEEGEYLPGSDTFVERLARQQEGFEFMQNNAQMLGGAFQSAFDAALISGESFSETLGKSLEGLIKQLVSAVITASALSLIFSAFGIGSFAGNFKSMFSQFGGFEFGLDGNDLVTSGSRTNKQIGRSR